MHEVWVGHSSIDLLLGVRKRRKPAGLGSLQLNATSEDILPKQLIF